MILQPQAQRRIVVDAVLFAFEPAVPPAHAFLQEADGRPGNAALRIEMAPGTGDALDVRALQILDQAGDRGRVAVGPAADGEDGASELAVVLAHRAVLPEGVAPLVLQPEGG